MIEHGHCRAIDTYMRCMRSLHRVASFKHRLKRNAMARFRITLSQTQTPPRTVVLNTGCEIITTLATPFWFCWCVSTLCLPSTQFRKHSLCLLWRFSHGIRSEQSKISQPKRPKLRSLTLWAWTLITSWGKKTGPRANRRLRFALDQRDGI